MAQVVNNFTIVRERIVFASWGFSGFDSAALDPLSQEPPVVKGSIGIPSSEVQLFRPPVDKIDTAVPEIVAFYIRDGLTPKALLRMTAEDALLRVPVSVLLARSLSDVPKPESPGFIFNKTQPRSLRGTVRRSLGPPRAVDQSAVPSEPVLPP